MFKSNFDTFEEVSFGNMTIIIPQGCHEILSTIYGNDFMTPKKMFIMDRLLYIMTFVRIIIPVIL